MIRGLAVAVVLAVAGVAGYIRLAPSDPVHWHVALTFDADRAFDNGVQRVVETGPDGLARLAAVAAAAPRTALLAGSVGEGRMTWVVRSRLWGFPDYVTAEQDGDRLKLYSRSRFGRSDFGVNRDRAELWLAQLG